MAASKRDARKDGHQTQNGYDFSPGHASPHAALTALQTAVRDTIRLAKAGKSPFIGQKPWPPSDLGTLSPHLLQEKSSWPR